jgi:hypothetical protein
MKTFLAAALASLLVQPATTQPNPALDELLDRAGKYVKQLEQDLSVVIADESYDQLVTSAASPVPLQRRRTQAEIAFVEVADEHDWTAIRNVVDVDGRQVRDRGGRIEAILHRGLEDRGTRVRALADESAKYNIGGI